MGSLYAKDVCKIADDWLGYHEGDNNWNIFAKVLDDCGYYAPQEKQNVPWCAVFCNFCVLQAAIPEDRDNDEKKWDAYYFQYQPSYNNYSAGAPQYASYFKNAGAWYDEPEVGDMCFFNTGSGIGHVGIVVDTDEYITTIEGNAGDQVQKKWYSYDDIGGKIVGFGRPRYDGIEDPSKVDHKPVDEKPVDENPKEDNNPKEDHKPTTGSDGNPFIKPGKDDDSTSQFDKTFIVKVDDELNVRSTPSDVDNSNIVGKLFNGAKVAVVETKGDWSRISGSLWVATKYLKKGK